MTNERKLPSKSPETHVRKPYVKPAFRREQVFETMALACGKAGTTSACQRVKKTS